MRPPASQLLSAHSFGRSHRLMGVFAPVIACVRPRAAAGVRAAPAPRSAVRQSHNGHGRCGRGPPGGFPSLILHTRQQPLPTLTALATHPLLRPALIGCCLPPAGCRRAGAHRPLESVWPQRQAHLPGANSTSLAVPPPFWSPAPLSAACAAAVAGSGRGEGTLNLPDSLADAISSGNVLSPQGEPTSRPLSGVGAGLLAFANLDGAPIGINAMKHEQLHMRRAAIISMVLRTTVRQLKLQSVRLLTVRGRTHSCAPHRQPHTFNVPRAALFPVRCRELSTEG